MLTQLTHAIKQGKVDLAAKNRTALKRINDGRLRQGREEEAEKKRQEEADKVRKLKEASKSISAEIHDFDYVGNGGTALEPITSASMRAQLSDCLDQPLI